MTTPAVNDFGPTDVPAAYRNQVLTAAARWGIPPALLAAQINQESGFNPSAKSPDGALGIAQFMPSTAASMGINPLNPSEAIDGMARLMSTYKKDYGSWEKALIAYHGGRGAVDNPGPNGLDYVRKILGKVGDLVGEAADAATPDNPMPETTALVARLRDKEFLQRVGIGMLGAFLVIAALVFIVLRNSAGQTAKIVKGVSNESGNVKRAVKRD